MRAPWWAFALCIAALAPYALTLLLFLTRSPWFASGFGRSFATSKAAIVLLLSHVLVVLTVGNYPWRIPVWVAIFVALAIAGTAQLVVLLREQRKDRLSERNCP